ncbi:MAG: hypothetical protein J0H46_04250 [Bacteroidetes bacterium]|nr:hypothetical protein [Bacteroidota bacterium]
MALILLSGGSTPNNDGFMLWIGLILFLGLVVGGSYLCRWVYNKLIHTRWHKNDITDIVD